MINKEIFAPLDGRIKESSFYAMLGFRSGLEIHQQLLTQKKLFCNCPAGRYTNDHDAEILRHMRPTMSELGEYDGTALMEFKTRKEIVYLLSRENVCTYEMDDTPPFMMNKDALSIAMEVALLAGCQLVNEVHVIRKQYLDGSIPTGFQRTAIVGVDGRIPFQNRHIEIVQVSIEEDSCREVSDQGHRITFRTDRLNMPLTEIVTGPEMYHPNEVAAVCEQLMRLTRVTQKVRTGAGAGREDVNVSITGGRRVEIKGVSRISLIPKLVHNEALRQYRLLKIRDHMKSLGLTSENIDGPDGDVTSFLSNGSSPVLCETIKQGYRVWGQVIRGARDVLRAPIQPGIMFGQELSGRIRVIACLDDPINLFVRDEIHGLGLVRHDGKRMSWEGSAGPSQKEWNELASVLNASENDGIVLFWGLAKDLQMARSEIRLRMVEALDGVPHETRMSHPQGTTDFERILPGPDRMYPDTDLPPMVIEDEERKRIAAILPRRPWEREDTLKALGLGYEQAKNMALASCYESYMDLVKHLKMPRRARVIAWLMCDLPKWLQRKGVGVTRLNGCHFIALAKSYIEGKIEREGFASILNHVCENRTEASVSEDDDIHMAIEALYAHVRKRLGENRNIKSIIDEVLKPFLKQSFSSSQARWRVMMKVVMSSYGGVLPGHEMSEGVKAWCCSNFRE